MIIHDWPLKNCLFITDILELKSHFSVHDVCMCERARVWPSSREMTLSLSVAAAAAVVNSRQE